MPVSPGTINGLSTMQTAASAGYISPGSPNYNYRLRWDSPAKDKATGSTVSDDIDGRGRPFNGVSDYGPNEYWPFPLVVVPGNGTMRLSWPEAATALLGSVSYYEVLVTCPAGANPPGQGSCGTPINVGTATTFTLTGLSNSKEYTLVVMARDSLKNLIATSTVVISSPVNLPTYMLYLPLVLG
jgi:hypothetical protein